MPSVHIIATLHSKFSEAKIKSWLICIKFEIDLKNNSRISTHKLYSHSSGILQEVMISLTTLTERSIPERFSLELLTHLVTFDAVETFCTYLNKGKRVITVIKKFLQHLKFQDTLQHRNVNATATNCSQRVVVPTAAELQL